MTTNSKARVKRYFTPPFILATEITTDVIFTIKGIAASGSGVVVKEDKDNGIVLEVKSWPKLKDTPDLGQRGAIEIYVTMDTDLDPNFKKPDELPNWIATKGVDAAWTQTEKDNGFTINIDKKFITPGAHYVTIFVSPRSGNMSKTLPLPFTILTRAGGGIPVNSLQFDDKYSIDGITKSNLINVDLKKALPALIAPYFEMRGNDIITLYIGTSEANLAAITTTTTVLPTQVGQTMAVDFDEAVLGGTDDGAADGPRVFSYTITNEAGYVSDKAIPVTLQLAFGARPTGLKAPRLPEVADNFITDNFTRALKIDVPKYDDVQVGDVVTLHFKHATVGDKAIGTSHTIQVEDIGLDPIFSFHVYHDDIKLYDKLSFIIYYVVGRGASSIIKTPSPEELVATMDLDIPAGPRPDQTSPENTNLQPLTITSASGETDTITGTAVSKNANITIPFEVVGGGAGVSYLTVGDVITVVWGTKTLAPPLIVATVPAANLSMTLLAADIPASGGGIIPAHYTVARKLSDNVHTGTSISPKKDILVNTTNTNPGGKDGLLKPYWLSRNYDETINFETMDDYHGCNFTVAKYDNISIGDLITLKLTGTEGFFPVNGAPVPAADYTSPPYAITAANIGQDDHNFLVPPAPFYRLCQGVVHVTYTVQRGAAGETFTSAELVEDSDMKSATASECTLPPNI
ncbi:hypothetical protein [Yersinia sp. Marseille-Q3913]|uniref:hypothetical protein n=1 Tax=Yersinia sp. Marseille-Q3913 TaxID=2830769 RepID=UPI001BAF0C79|nr:hypothetical protein [Yersinia sp. Marseille-Q3913]MBS0053870.1 hypothetical protein [Yersinia sp. Marseille-Q3913]